MWRQKHTRDKGGFVQYEARNISPDMSFLEMLDVVNEGLIARGEDPIAFDHDCREGICGMCGFVINGIAHGPRARHHGVPAPHAQLQGWRYPIPRAMAGQAFPVIKDLVVNRSAFDRIIQSGGFISVSTGGAPEANSLPVSKEDAELSMDAAECIGCGACVAACPNASAMLFTAAKIVAPRITASGAAGALSNGCCR